MKFPSSRALQGTAGLVLAASIQHAWAVPRNITVHDDDPMIVYHGEWFRATDPFADGGSHMVTADPEAHAVLIFNGTDVFYAAPKWAHDVTTWVEMQYGPTPSVSFVEPIFLHDSGVPEQPHGSPATVPSSVVWSWRALEPGVNKRQMLQMGMTSSSPFAIVDTIIYTVEEDDEDDAANVDTSPGTEATNPAGANKSPPLSPGTAAAIGAAGGVVGLLLVLGLIWFCVRRRRKAAAAARSTPGIVILPDSPQTTRFPVETRQLLPPGSVISQPPSPNGTYTTLESSVNKGVMVGEDGAPLTGSTLSSYAVTQADGPSQSYHDARISAPPPAYEYGGYQAAAFGSGSSKGLSAPLYPQEKKSMERVVLEPPPPDSMEHDGQGGNTSHGDFSVRNA